jgi:hypothetical protein
MPLETVTTSPTRQHFARISSEAVVYKSHLYHTSDQIKNIEDEIKCYMKKINEDIGFYWWKRYIYTAFWSNISTPINLSIIILTAITTGENATQNLIGQNVSTILGVVVLFVSIFNTFFQPNEQLAQNKKILADWLDVGAEFDEIYYDKVYTSEEKYGRLKNLEELFKSVSVLKRANDSNFIIDLLYACMRCICLRNNINWIDMRNDDRKPPKNLHLTLSEPSSLVNTDADNTSHTGSSTYSSTNSSTNSSTLHVASTTV